MSINKGMMTSKTDVWETPQAFFNEINKEFNFTLDVCCNEDNHKCDLYFTEKENGLTQKWTGICWMNPPYGRDIIKWVKKADESNCLVVGLLPARTDTKWFHDYCIKHEVRFIKGRLKFGGSKNSAPFPSMLVIFK